MGSCRVRLRRRSTFTDSVYDLHVSRHEILPPTKGEAQDFRKTRDSLPYPDLSVGDGLDPGKWDCFLSRNVLEIKRNIVTNNLIWYVYTRLVPLRTFPSDGPINRF